MPPPVTPSPHRFLPASSAQSQNRPRATQSSLRHQFESLSSSSQIFQPTPRFAAPSSSSKAQPETIDSPTSSPIAPQASRRPPRHVRNDQHALIDEAQPLSTAAYGLSEATDPNSEDELLDLLLPAPKRKRLSPSPPPGPAPPLIVLSSSPPPDPSPPISPIAVRQRDDQQRTREVTRNRAHSTSAPPRFHIPGDPPETPTAARVGDANAPLLRTSRPGFVLPPRGNPETELNPKILPEVFSPHKRGSKVFVPGGMASTVRDWVLVLESKQVRSSLGSEARRRRTPAKKVEQLGHDITIGQMCTRGLGSLWTVATLTGDHWILVESQAHTNPGALVLAERDEIHINPPTWNVQVDGQQWNVAIAWAKVGNI